MLFRGSKSRNKVSVGEPAEGSLQVYFSSFLELKYTKNLLSESRARSVVCALCDTNVERGPVW